MERERERAREEKSMRERESEGDVEGKNAPLLPRHPQMARSKQLEVGQLH